MKSGSPVLFESTSHKVFIVPARKADYYPAFHFSHSNRISNLSGVLSDSRSLCWNSLTPSAGPCLLILVEALTAFPLVTLRRCKKSCIGDGPNRRCLKPGESGFPLARKIL